MKSFKKHIILEAIARTRDPYTTKSGKDVDKHVSEYDHEIHGNIPSGKPDHHILTNAGTDLYIHHVKNPEGKTTHTIISTGGQHQNAGSFHVPGKANPKHIEKSWNRAERDDYDDY